jgi:phosphoribosylaminoimidazole-succinocarboxamide synthase
VRGHDEDISAIEIVSHGWATMEQWDYIEEKVIMLFRRGWEIANKWGIILVDTKYEFGQDEAGKIYLIDEIHTPDSSRYWHKDTYEDSLKNGEEPKALSKEFVRQWLIERGFQGRKGDIMPFFPQDFIHSITDRYMEFYTKMGLPLSALESDDDSTLYESVCQSLEKFR